MLGKALSKKNCISSPRLLFLVNFLTLQRSAGNMLIYIDLYQNTRVNFTQAFKNLSDQVGEMAQQVKPTRPHKREDVNLNPRITQCQMSGKQDERWVQKNFLNNLFYTVVNKKETLIPKIVLCPPYVHYGTHAPTLSHSHTHIIYAHK